MATGTQISIAMMQMNFKALVLIREYQNPSDGIQAEMDELKFEYGRYKDVLPMSFEEWIEVFKGSIETIVVL